MALLEVRGVSKVFGQLTALDGIDLTVEEGEFHGLIGPNGSGKSTADEMHRRRRGAEPGHDRFRRARHHRCDAGRARPRRPQPQIPDHQRAARAHRL